MRLNLGQPKYSAKNAIFAFRKERKGNLKRKHFFRIVGIKINFSASLEFMCVLTKMHFALTFLLLNPPLTLTI